MFSKEQQQVVNFLQKLTAIPDYEIQPVVSLFQPLDLRKNEHFVEAGQTSTTLAFVVHGVMRLYYISEAGEEFTKEFCGENEFVAAYSALLLSKPSRLYIQALEDTKLLIVPFRHYQSLTEGRLCWEIINRKLVEALFIKKEWRVSSLLLEDAQTRYLNFLAENPGLESRVKQHHIASYLAITPVSLSRIRAHLKALT